MTFDLTLPHDFFAQSLGLEPTEQGAYFDRRHIVTSNSRVAGCNAFVESTFESLNDGNSGNPIEIDAGTANGMVAPKTTLGGMIMGVAPHALHPNAFDELFFDSDFDPGETDPDVRSTQSFNVKGM